MVSTINIMNSQAYEMQVGRNNGKLSIQLAAAI